jgi:hypothetical protein
MIVYEPSKLIKRLAPKTKIRKMVGYRLDLKKTALGFVDDLDFISKRSVSSIALKTLKSYKERAKGDPDLRDELKADPAQLIQRVQNEVLLQVTDEIKDKYSGEYYVWLPSDADEPDPEHQLNYGQTFQIGDGEMPGDRIGCRCGMQILTEDDKLQLG